MRLPSRLGTRVTHLGAAMAACPPHRGAWGSACVRESVVEPDVRIE
jgi:hypothetical protein